jgi:hypothetical protein
VCVAGRRLRKKTEETLNYMYATLGIEKDDSSDDDYILEEDDESEEEEHLSINGSDAERKPGMYAVLMSVAGLPVANTRFDVGACV